MKQEPDTRVRPYTGRPRQFPLRLPEFGFRRSDIQAGKKGGEGRIRGRKRGDRIKTEAQRRK